MSKRWSTLTPFVAVGLLVAAAGLWWFFSGDTPDEVSLDAATASVADDVEDPSSADADADADADISGVWTVDTETGTFDYESATGSFVGFRIAEELSGIGSTTAVGRTGDVTGSLTIDGSTVTDATFTVDMTTLTTNDSRRDNNVQDALDTDRFPTASFTLSSPIDLGDGAARGEPVTATVTGDLTIHDITREVAIPIEAQLVDDTVVVVGSTNITFADFDVAVPPSRVVLSVEDNGPLELQLLFTRP